MAMFRTSDGAELYYEDRGKGPTLLLIPGWTMTARFWRAQVEQLTDRFRMIVLEPRCHGQSSKVAHGLRMARLGADVREAIDGLALENVHAVGWSMGASALWAMVDIFGTRGIKGFTFVDQPPKLLNEDGWSYGFPGITRVTLNAQTAAIVDRRREFCEAFIPGMFHAPLERRDLAWMTEQAMLCPSEFAAEMLIDHCNQDWRDVFARIDKPALVVAGAHSAARPGTKIIAELTPGARYVEFQHSKHCPFMEEADAFNATLASFVNDTMAIR